MVNFKTLWLLFNVF